MNSYYLYEWEIYSYKSISNKSASSKMISVRTISRVLDQPVNTCAINTSILEPVSLRRRQRDTNRAASSGDNRDWRKRANNLGESAPPRLDPPSD